MDLVRDANDTASRTRASVTRLLGLLVAALAEVVGAGVDDDGALRKVSLPSLIQKFPKTLGRVVVQGEGRLTPITLSDPISLISLSSWLPWQLPWPSVLKLPRSPTWRSSSEGAP
jgi:hypothetical protein